MSLRLTQVALRPLSIVSLMAVIMIVVWGCRTTPVSGRRQLVVIPEAQEIAMGEEAYLEILKTEPRSTNQRYVELVRRVGNRIKAVAGRDDYDWEFNVIASDTPNAFCLPGGKVAFYEGILPVCESEAGVAVVMSHEIAHALARHGGERMSHQVAMNTGSKVLEIFTKDHDEDQQRVIMQVYGVGSKFGAILPYSRKHEAEADSIGIQLMAKAGYDPSEAVRFWERFGAMKDGETVLEIFSTHPSDASRATALRQQLPKAEELYAQAKNKYGLGEMIALSAPKPRIRQAAGEQD